MLPLPLSLPVLDSNTFEASELVTVTSVAALVATPKVTTPEPCRSLPTTRFGTVIEFTVTFTGTVPVVYPVAIPVIVVDPAVVSDVTVATVLDEPAATVTVAGTVATAVLLLLRFTVTPPVPAVCPRVTIRPAVAFPFMSSGEGENVMLVFGTTVIVTVDGADVSRPSLTTSSSVKVPRMSALNVGATLFASASVAVDPLGIEVKRH